MVAEIRRDVKAMTAVAGYVWRGRSVDGSNRFIIASEDDMPGLFLSHAYLAGVQERVKNGDGPWRAAFEGLITAAGAALAQEPLSVRDNGGSPHFRVDAVYVPGKDGVMNTESNMDSRILAGRMSDAATNLALAWRLTGEAKYANKALVLIHTWCINQNTLMFPTGRVEDAWTQGAAYGGDVVMFLSFWKLFLAVHLLDEYPGWDFLAHSGVKRWIKRMIDPQRDVMFFEGRQMYNNWEDERLVYLAHGALALGDLDLLAYVFDRWRHILPLKMTLEGELPRETMRTRSMTYTLMALHAAIVVAEIGRQFGVNLYDLEVNGRGLKRGIDYAAGYLLKMEAWPHPMIAPLAKEQAKGSMHLGLFEMAYHYWGDARYLEIIEAYGGRPVAEGHATLLYGRG
jgi:hypothetical protein